MLSRLDDFLIDHVSQPACDHVQVRFARSNIWLAEQFAFAACAMYLLSEAWELRADTLAAVDTGFMLVMLDVYSSRILWGRQRPKSELAGAMYVERAVHRPIRPVLVIMVIVFALPGMVLEVRHTAENLPRDLNLPFLPRHVYVRACSTRPGNWRPVPRNGRDDNLKQPSSALSFMG